MEKVQKLTGSQTWWNYWTWQKTASGSNVQSTKWTCYRNLTWQNKAWQYSTKCIWQKSLTDHKPKRTRRYDGNHLNIAIFLNRFQTQQKTEHGRNNNMNASWWAWYTHHKAMHDKTSTPTARWHVYEAIHGKSKYISCMEQLQQAWQNWITRKKSANKSRIACMDQLQQAWKK